MIKSIKRTSLAKRNNVGYSLSTLKKTISGLSQKSKNGKEKKLLCFYS